MSTLTFPSLVPTAVLSLLVLLSLLTFASGGAFNWCFYSASAPATSPSFTISASGTMFTGAYSSYLGRPGWQVLYMTGTRLQTLNGVASTAFITGVAPQFSFAGNDNFLFTSWPYLNGGTSCSPGGGNGTWNGCTTNGTTPGGGISYTVFNNATTPASTTSQGRFNLNGDPANEYPLHSQDGNDRLTPGPTITAPSYFMFQQLSDPNPLNCIPPTAASSTYASTIFSFAYQATPSTQNVLSSGGQGLWSSCATGTWQLVGPFNVPSGPSSVSPQYALVAASGVRTFVSGSTVQTVNLTGVDGEDGADFRVYVSQPYVDDAGITFTANQPPYFSNGATVDTTSTDRYSNLWNPGGQSVQEANYADAGNFVSLQYAVKGTNAAIDSYQCPATTAIAKFFTFCHFAQGPTNTNPTWTVTTYGTLISTPQSGLSYFVTDISGTRVQTGANPSTSTITGLATPGSVSNGRNSNTNQISVAFPFLDYGGIAYSLSAAVTLPPNATGGTSTTNTIDLFNQPPCEAGTCTWTNAYNPGIPQLNSGVAYFLIQPASYGLYTASTCGSPTVMGTKTVNFGYTASPRLDSTYYLTAANKPATDMCNGNASPKLCPLWSACVSATLQVIGPFLYPGLVAGTNDSAYIVTGATGSRVYADVSGRTGTVQITGAGNDDGADNTLYTTFPYVDDAGITFSTSAPPTNPLTDVSSNTYFNLWSPQENGLNVGQTASEALIPNYQDNVAVLQWTVGGSAYTCPSTYTTPQLVQLSFCIFIQSAPSAASFTIVSNGTLYGTATSGGYYITGVTGTRYAYSGTAAYPATFRLQSTVSLTSVQIASGDNTIHTPYYPSLSSGLTLGLSAPVTLPDTSTSTSSITYAGMPVNEVGVDPSNVDTAYFAYQLVGNGPLPCGPSASTSQLTFYYTAVPQPLNALQASYGVWSSCMSAILTVVGPIQYPVAGSTTTTPAYVVVAATGYRVFTGANGVSSTTAISNINGGVGGGLSSRDDGADFLLYTAAPYVDDAGITFEMAGVPVWPNSNDPGVAQSLQLTYVNVWSSGALINNQAYATEAILPDTVNNQLSISVGAYSGGSVQQCANSQMTLSSSGVSSVVISGGGSSSNLSGGKIAGIVIGTVAGVVLLLMLVVCGMLQMQGGGGKKAAGEDKVPAAKRSYQSQVELEESTSTVV